MSKSEIRWGIIGCGDVTEVKSGPAFYKCAGSRLVAVMRRDAAKAADYARRHNVARSYNDAAKLIADAEVDAVYVATPPGSHMDYAIAAASAGKPVYVEKPMARTHDECQRMIGACAAAGVKLFVAYYRRGMPRFVRVKALVDSGRIGEVRGVQVLLHHALEKGDLAPEKAWRVVPEIAGAGRFLDLASHTLDVLDWVLGPIVRATGMAANLAKAYAAEDGVGAVWQHQSGTIGTGQWVFAAASRADTVTIIGSQGTLRFSTFGTEPIVLERGGGGGTEREEFTEPTPQHVQMPLVQQMVDELLGQGQCPSTGLTAARTSWVMDRVLEGWRAGVR